MWFFGKKKLLKDRLIDCTDYHSHILPDVDDGSQSIEESLAILSFYEEQGVENVWLTPHIMEDIPNSTVHLKERFAELQTAYNGKIKLNLAAEYMLDNLFEERLSGNDLLPLGEKGDHLLIETSYFNPPMHFTDALKRVKSKGFYPILAHPERYMYMEDEDYARLKEMGIKFQLNITSLMGFYGRAVQETATRLNKRSMYEYKGTDVHDLQVLKKILKK